MQVKYAEIEISAVRESQYPLDHLPEIALAGRSNVGKSSFINSLIERKGLARTSSKPGKTQTLNFYNINHSFRFVDVPGYGYARASKESRRAWSAMIETYLHNREELSILFLLMDMRHPPTSLDKEMKNLAESLDIPYAIVLNKADKVKGSAWNKQLSIFKKDLNLPSVDALFIYSSVTGQGKEDIWDVIESFLGDEIPT